MANHEDRVVIDLTEEGEAAYDEEIRRIADHAQREKEDDERNLSLPGHHEYQPQGRRGPKKQRNAPLNDTHRTVQAYRVANVEYRIDDFFELARPVGDFWKAQFLEIKQIWVSFTGNEVLLRGLPYARNSSMHGRFRHSINEVCQILEIDDDDKRPDEQQAMIEVRPHETLAIRTFHMTNTDYTSARNCRYGNDPTWIMLQSEDRNQRKRDFAPLTCRWKMKFQYRNASFREAGKALGASAIHLLADDIHDPAYRIPDEERRREWLQRHPPSAGRQTSVQREYTYGDAFCGAGGASSGARQGGLKPTIAIDSWDTACRSYRLNFPDAILLQQPIHDFVVSTPFDALPYIDVLHISPPCQHFSPANTHKREDDPNEAVLFCCGKIIKHIRPRVFTMEQTYGLLAERFTGHFNSLIQDITELGYSVQWQERVELILYGLPQNRKRLIIIGAGPGEQLPPWPAPTHGYGRKPLATEAMAIGGRFPRNVTLHDVRNARQVYAAPRNPHVPLPRTICCTGPSQMIHYSGQRDFTIRELATLNGYPLDHEFVGPSKTAIKKQIGNAFPALVAKVFFESIRKFLERQDRIRNLTSGTSSGPNGHQRPQTAASGAPGPRMPPEYSRLNGDLDEDEALQLAMRESRRERRHQTKEVIIIIDDSDSSDDDAGGSLSQNMARLSVEPTQPSPPSTGESSRSRQTAWSFRSTPHQPRFGSSHRRAPSSAASSFTMANSPRPSPRPSPCQQQQSRKRKAADDQPESARKRVHDNTVSIDDEEDEVYYEARIADRARARAAARKEVSLSLPREEEGRLLAFGERSWLGRLPLPVTSGREEGWEF